MSELASEFWSDFIRPENFIGHVAYMLLIVSMMMRNMNWLRFFAVLAGTLSAIFYFVIRDFVSMFWETIFTLVNLVQYVILSFENRRGKFSDEENFFISICLPEVERAHARKLVKIGAWVEANEGEVLIEQDGNPSFLKFLVQGEADVIRDGEKIGGVGPGDFIGEISFLTEGNATAKVVATDLVRFLSFDHNRLRSHLEKRPEIRHALEASFNRNLIEKLKTTNIRKTNTVSGNLQ